MSIFTIFLFAHHCFFHLLLSIQLNFFFLNKNLWLLREAPWMVNSVFAWRCLYFTWIQILNEIVPGYRIRGWQFPSAFWKYCPKALWPLLLLRALGQGCCHSFVGSLFLSDCVKDALCHWMVWLTDICYYWNMRGWMGPEQILFVGSCLCQSNESTKSALFWQLTHTCSQEKTVLSNGSDPLTRPLPEAKSWPQDPGITQGARLNDRWSICPHKPLRESESALKGRNRTVVHTIPGSGYLVYTLPACPVLTFGLGYKNVKKDTLKHWGSLRCRVQSRAPPHLGLSVVL